MANYKKTAAELLRKMLDKIDNSYQKTIGFPTHDILNAVAMVGKDIYEKINDYFLKLNAENLNGDELTRFVFQNKGIVRKEATKATVQLTITGNGLIKAGSLFETPLGIQFETLESLLLNNNTDTVPAQAVTPGSSGNVPAGSITEMPVTIQGVTAVTNEDPSAGGYNMESDADLWDRYIMALQEPPTSGNIYHYKQWALEVTGVGGAKVYPLWNGANTVQVVIIDSNGEPASEALVEAVQNHIDPGITGRGEGEAPTGAYCTVTAATALTLNLELTLLGNYPDTLEGDIKDSVKAYLQSIAFEQNYVSYAKIANAISDTEGLIDYMNLTVNGDVKNIEVPDKSVAVLGGIEYVDLEG